MEAVVLDQLGLTEANEGAPCLMQAHTSCLGQPSHGRVGFSFPISDAQERRPDTIGGLAQLGFQLDRGGDGVPRVPRRYLHLVALYRLADAPVLSW
jgi:hypothetical protein